MANGSATRKRASASAQMAPSILQEEIAKMAYELYQQRGCASGNEQEDWLEAERQLRQQRQRASAR